MNGTWFQLCCWLSLSGCLGMYPSIIRFAVSPSVLTYLALQSPGLDAVEFTHVYSFGSWLLLHDSNIVVTFCSNESSQTLMIQCVVNFAIGSQVLSSIWYSCFLWFQMSPYCKSFFRVVIALLSPSPSASLSPPLLLCFIQNGHAFCGHRSRVSNLSSVPPSIDLHHWLVYTTRCDKN